MARPIAVIRVAGAIKQKITIPVALDFADDQGWFEDAEVDDDASWVSLTPAGVIAAKS